MGSRNGCWSLRFGRQVIHRTTREAGSRWGQTEVQTQLAPSGGMAEFISAAGSYGRIFSKSSGSVAIMSQRASRSHPKER